MLKNNNLMRFILGFNKQNIDHIVHVKIRAAPNSRLKDSRPEEA